MKMKPISELKIDLGINPGGRIRKFMVETCARHMDKFIPYSGEGNNTIHMRENIEKGDDYITYKAPYAHAQYVGYTTGPVLNYTTPGTGPYWDEAMWSAESEQVLKEIQEEIERNG